MIFKIERKTETAQLPTKVDPRAVGWDVFADSIKIEGGCIVIDTGISVEPPEGYWFGLYPRSSQSKYEWVYGNSVGVIEPDYRGHIMAKLRPVGVIYETDEEMLRAFNSSVELPFNVGDRIGQIVLHHLVDAKGVETTLTKTVRGEKGFGSTGK